MYKNHEGYQDPTAGQAERAARRDSAKKSRERRLTAMQDREDYEVTTRAIRALAEERGFSFTRDIWLVQTSTGKVFKGE